MIRKHIGLLLVLAGIAVAGGASAESGGGGSGYVQPTGHYETQTAYTSKTVTTCNPYNTQVAVGDNNCTINPDYSGHGGGGADFTGTASCSARSYTQMVPNCQTSTIQVPTTIQVWVEEKDPCAIGGSMAHGQNCGRNGGGGTSR